MEHRRVEALSLCEAPWVVGLQGIDAPPVEIRLDQFIARKDDVALGDIVSFAASRRRRNSLRYAPKRPVLKHNNAFSRAQIGNPGITAAAEGKGRATCRSRAAVVVAIGCADCPVPRPVHVGLVSLAIPANAIPVVWIHAVSTDLLHINVAAHAAAGVRAVVDCILGFEALARIKKAEASRLRVSLRTCFLNRLHSLVASRSAAATIWQVRGRGYQARPIVVCSAKAVVPERILIVEVAASCLAMVPIPAKGDAGIWIVSGRAQLEHVVHPTHMPFQARACCHCNSGMCSWLHLRHADFSIWCLSIAQARRASGLGAFGEITSFAAGERPSRNASKGDSIDVGAASVPVGLEVPIVAGTVREATIPHPIAALESQDVLGAQAHKVIASTHPRSVAFAGIESLEGRHTGCKALEADALVRIAGEVSWSQYHCAFRSNQGGMVGRREGRWDRRGTAASPGC
mmetsp:Transcript_19626/g.74225  ORF Transcript_19626/g.74225 Transcript_19626/m.74225 type:complete len:459 (-) Transcript_19626:4383-5759(-)